MLSLGRFFQVFDTDPLITSTRQLFSSTPPAPWEPIVGYSRAVRVGNTIHVCGTAAVGHDGTTVSPNDPGAQTRFILHKIAGVLAQAGASMSHVVRTRIYVTDIARWEEVGRVHGEFFKDIRPATTMVEVSRLIALGMCVEIEAEAIVTS